MRGTNFKPVLIGLSLGLFLHGPAGAAKIKRAPRKAAPIYGSRRRVKAAPAPQKGLLLPKPPEPFKHTGIDLTMPPVEGDMPLFRVLTRDGEPAEGSFGQWSPFTPEEPKDSPPPPGDTPGSNAPSPAAATKSVFEKDSFLHQTVTVLPGSYDVHFSLPVPADPLRELSGTYTWTQPVRVSKERLTGVKVAFPALPPSGTAHVRIKKAGPMTPFNQLSLEPLDAKGGGKAGRWDYFSPEAVWPDEVSVALLAGSYRVILTAPGGDTYSSLRYEFPDPVTVGAASEVPIQRPKFNSLKAKFTDRKGSPLIGAPVMLRGTGETSIITDSGRGEIDIRIPVDRYAVRVLVFDDRGSREVTVDRELDLSADQDRTWKVPVDTIDFGFSAPPATTPVTK